MGSKIPEPYREDEIKEMEDNIMWRGIVWGNTLYTLSEVVRKQ